MIEREQVCEELDNMQKRFEDSVAETQQRISQECEVVRRASENTHQQLEARVSDDCLLCLCDVM